MPVSKTITKSTVGTVSKAARTVIDVAVADDAIMALVERLRLSRVRKSPLHAASIVLTPPPADDLRSVIIDVDNGLADVDARLSLHAIGYRLKQQGYWLPMLRPWSSMPLWRLAMTAPFVVDALIQRGTLLSVDGDVIDTPRAPRHAAGPSLLHGLCARPSPTALLVRAHLRVVPRTHARLVVTDWGSANAAARAFVTVTDAARAVCVEAFGSNLAVLADDHGAADVDVDVDSDRGSAWGSMSARVMGSRSIGPGDRPAIVKALCAGQRVVGVPFMQRAGVLLSTTASGASPLLVDVSTATTQAASAIAAALTRPQERDQ
jgi:hypothetical protein